MDKINFLAKSNFPVSTYTYDLMQQMTNLVATLTALGGQNYILSGCVESADRTTVSDGVVVINGEILPFKGGEKKDKIAIQVVKETDNFAGVSYPEAYIHRTAVFDGSGAYNWADFMQITSIIELKKILDGYNGDPIGVVKEWAGLITKVPSDYLPCDGRSLSKNEYPELFDAIGFTYGGLGEEFKLPDFRGRFAVGFDNAKDDYNVLGSTGGEEKHTLSTDELPEHKHIMPWGENVNTAWSPPWDYADGYLQGMRGSDGNDSDNAWAYSSPIGKNKAHENRPPYLVIYKIIKVK